MHFKKTPMLLIMASVLALATSAAYSDDDPAWPDALRPSYVVDDVGRRSGRPCAHRLRVPDYESSRRRCRRQKLPTPALTP